MKKEKKILYIPNDPLEEYYKFKQTYNMYPFKYFDPLNYFDRIYFSYLSPLRDLVKRKGKFSVIRIKRTSIFKNKILNYFNIFDYIKFIIRTNKIVRDNNIGLIRSYNNHVEGFLATLVGKMTNTPSVISVHNDYYYERRNTKISDISAYFIANTMQRILEFFSNRMATKIFCVSTYLKRQLITYGKVQPSKIEVTFNKVEISKFSKSNKKKQQELIKKYRLKDKKAFLFIGRFVWQKNIFTLLKAFKEIHAKDEKTALLLVSDGPLKGKIMEYLDKNRLNDCISLLGTVSNDLLPDLFKISDAFILPSFYEGFGIVLIEAQASGCPVIVSDIPSVKDIVSEDNAWLFNPKKREELTGTMRMFLSNKNKEKINKKTAQALKDVKRFEWDRLAKKDIEFYKGIMK